VSNPHPFRSAAAFFLLTFSTAFLFTIGVRMTGWFTRLPEFEPENVAALGVSIMVAVTCLALGAGLRRMSAAEMQSALLGASAVLLATPLSQAVITNEWQWSTAAVSGLGLLALALGLLVAVGRRNED
jgi:hypothetical protein